MNVFDISKRMNLIHYSLITMVLSAIIFSILAQLNFDNFTPKNYVGVVIEGDDKRFLRMYIEDRPTVNAESAKEVVVDYVNRIMNYNSRNYTDVIKNSVYIFDKSYYKSFSSTMYKKIKEDIDNGYYITRSIVSEKPMLIGKAYDGKNMLYRYKLKTATIYKSELREVALSHDIIVAIKVEDPRDNIKGLSIAHISIY